MTKRRLVPKQQQFVEDYIAELNKLEAMPIFNMMSLAEVAKHITSVLRERADLATVEDIETAITQKLEHTANAIRCWRTYSKEHLLPCSLWLSTEGRDRRIGYGLWGILFIWRD